MKPFNPGQLLRFYEEDRPIRDLWIVYLVERSVYGAAEGFHSHRGRWQVLNMLTGVVDHLPEGHLQVYYKRVS